MRIVVGISGASGAALGVRLLVALKEAGVETHLVISEGARLTLTAETGLRPAAVEALASRSYGPHDLAAAIASGSYPVDAVVIAPCSMKTVAGVAAGYAENLLLRAADVALKEGRPLVLVPRETPLSRLHLRNLKELADYGATIVPPMLTFYSGADTVEKQIDHVVGKIFSCLGLEYPRFRRWEGSK